MFTGLVESTGTVLALEPRGESARLTLQVGIVAPMQPRGQGSSGNGVIGCSTQCVPQLRLGLGGIERLEEDGVSYAQIRIVRRQSNRFTIRVVGSLAVPKLLEGVTRQRVVLGLGQIGVPFQFGQTASCRRGGHAEAAPAPPSRWVWGRGRGRHPAAPLAAGARPTDGAGARRAAQGAAAGAPAAADEGR